VAALETIFFTTLLTVLASSLKSSVCPSVKKVPVWLSSQLDYAGACEPEGAGELAPGLLHPDGGLSEGAPVPPRPPGRVSDPPPFHKDPHPGLWKRMRIRIQGVILSSDETTK